MRHALLGSFGAAGCLLALACTGVKGQQPVSTNAPSTASSQSQPGTQLSVDQLKARAAMADKLHGTFNFDTINEAFFVAVGSPDQVANQLGEWGEMMGTNHFNILGAIGNMPHWKVVKNLSFLAEEVIPRMRAEAPLARQVAAE